MKTKFFMQTQSHRGYVLCDEDGNSRPAPSGRYIDENHTIHRETIKYDRRNGGGWEHIFSCTCGWKTRPKQFHHSNRPALEHYEDILAATKDSEMTDDAERDELRRALFNLKHATLCVKSAQKKLLKRREEILEIQEAKRRVRERGRE